MTDNEIIKALECCGAGICKEECFGYFMKGTSKCTTELTKNALALINRQKAEIEELREIVFMDRSEAIKQLKADAVKEFAERLKSKHRRILDYDEAGFSAPTDIVYVETIHNLVKEFTE